MLKNDSMVGDCKCGQFSQVKVCTEHDVNWTVSLQISYRPCLQPVEKKKDRQPSISRSVPHAVMMLLDAVCQQHWWIPTRLEKHTVTLKEWRPCKRASTNRHTCRYCAVIWQHTKTARICWSNWQVVCDSNAENLNGSDAANVRYRWRQIVSGLTYTHTVCEYCFSWLWPV